MHRRRSARSVRIGLPAGVLTLLVGADGASAQSFWTSTSGGSILGGQRNTFIFMNGHHVRYADMPRLGISLDTGQRWSTAVYPFFPGAMIEGVPAWIYGYPPYYGPVHLFSHGGSGPLGYPFFDFNPRAFYWSRFHQGPPLVEIARRVDPAIVNLPAPGSGGGMISAPAPTAPPPDPAIEALRAGEYARAVDLLRERVEQRQRQETESPDSTEIDRTALRLYGLALVGAGRLADAAEAFARAYEEDPALESAPLDGRSLLSGSRELRGLVLAAIGYAREAGSPQAWQMVAHLMVAEGREDRAKLILEEAGLTSPEATEPEAPTIPGGIIPDSDPEESASPG